MLDHFLGGPPDVAEAAFAVLLDRHGVMVRRTCRQATGNLHDAEDAAQATFLVLVHSARSVRSADSLAAWLHGVARRVSARANAEAARRRARERRSVELVAEASPRREPWPEVHEELDRLPERYRLPIVLCHLEGLSHEQAARQLRCPVRTLQSRLARGRVRLRTGLERRGFGPHALSLVVTLAPESAPAEWARATVRLAMLLSTTGGPTTAGSVPVASALAEKVLRAMMLKNVKVALTLGLLAAGAGSLALTHARAMPAGSATTDEPSRRATIDARAVPSGPGVAVKGRVAGPDGKPLAGAKVQSPILKTRETAVTTGPDGRFTITAEEIPRGGFPLRLDAPGLASKMFAVETAPRPRTTPPLEPVAITHLMGPTGEIADPLTMDRGTVITGRIVRDAKPVPGVTVGLRRDVHGHDILLGSPEVKTNADGRFRFPHAPADSRCWLYVPTGSLGQAGAVTPGSLRTGAKDSTIDLGDVAVRRGRTVSGRVIFADGKPLPADADVVASADHAAGVLRAKPDRSGRFTLVGLPEGQVEVCVYFPVAKYYAPAGYRVSAKNKCLDPLNPWRLVGRVDRDVADLTILFEPGEQPAPDLTPGRQAVFKEAQTGPITGAPPARD